MTIAEFINKVGFKVNNDDVDKVNGTIAEIKSTATKLLGAIGIGFSLTQINQMVEEFGRVNNQIRNSTAALGDQNEIQQKILKSATDTRTSYESTAKVVSNLVKENKNLFGNVDEAVKFNNAATMLFKTAGKTNEEISGLMEEINKSFAKGKVETGTISQLLERSPEAVELLNRKLGTTSDKLEEMASSGKIKVEDLKNAFVESADEIEKNFGNVQYTVSDALLVIRNKWGFWLSDMDQTLGVTKSIAKVMVSGFNSIMNVLNKVKTGLGWLAEKLGGSENLLKLLVITAGALVIAFNFSKIVSGFKKIMSAVGGLNLKLLGIAAIIIIVALLVEDFINFMQGNDSLIGSMLEKAGIDCDALRQTIINAWNGIKDKLGVLWESVKEAGSMVWERIKEAAESIFNALKAFWDKWGGTITATFQKLFGLWKEYFNAFLDVIIGIVDFIGAIFAGDWEAAWQAICDVFIGLWDMIKAYIQMVWEWIKLIFQIACDFILGIVQAIWAGISSFFLGIWESIVAYFQGVWQSICDVFSGVVEWFSGIFSAAWEGIKNIFSAVGGFFQGIWNTIKNIFVSIGQTIADGVSGAFKATVNAVIGFAEKIINGFIGGINKAIGLINKIPGVSIPKISTISIPKLAEGGYVGANKPQMAIIGDNKHEGEIVSPVSKMKEAMYDVMKMFSSAYKPVQATQALVQPHKNFVITQNIEFNNEFNGDTAIQRSASTAMDKSAKDVTAQLARGLAYAR